MKLKIKAGESIEDAMQYVESFLKQFKGEYPILKSNMSVYFTLSDSKDKDCPDNDREFNLSGQGVVDVEHERYEKAKQVALSSWTDFFKYQNEEYQSILHKIDLDKAYINTAEENNRQPANVEKRKSQLANNMKRLSKAEEERALLQRLNARVRRKDVKWHFEKRMTPKQSYQYYIIAHICFVDVNGSDWHYLGQKYAPYGATYLRLGLPENFQPKES